MSGSRTRDSATSTDVVARRARDARNIKIAVRVFAIFAISMAVLDAVVVRAPVPQSSWPTWISSLSHWPICALWAWIGIRLWRMGDVFEYWKNASQRMADRPRDAARAEP